LPHLQESNRALCDLSQSLTHGVGYCEFPSFCR
jgi:hypothetical protein